MRPTGRYREEEPPADTARQLPRGIKLLQEIRCSQSLPEWCRETTQSAKLLESGRQQTQTKRTFRLMAQGPTQAELLREPIHMLQGYQGKAAGPSSRRSKLRNDSLPHTKTIQKALWLKTGFSEPLLEVSRDTETAPTATEGKRSPYRIVASPPNKFTKRILH